MASFDDARGRALEKMNRERRAGSENEVPRSALERRVPLPPSRTPSPPRPEPRGRRARGAVPHPPWLALAPKFFSEGSRRAFRSASTSRKGGTRMEGVEVR